MLDSFDKESKLHERRAARQRQMQLMEAAASGLPLSGTDTDTDRVTSTSVDVNATNNNNSNNTIATSTQRSPSDLLDVHDNGNGINNNLHNLPPTISDIEQTFTIDDDDDEFEGPPSIFSNPTSSTSLSSPPTNANAHLWKSNAEIKIDEEKLGFITGDNTGSHRSGGYGREHDESRDLLLLASRRLAQQGENTPPRSNGSGRMNMSSLNIDSGTDAYGHDDDFRNRRSSYGITLPNCCILHRRTICATLMILTLVIVLLAVVEPARQQNAAGDGNNNTNNNSGGGGISSAPWADTVVDSVMDNHPGSNTNTKPMDTAEIAKFNRIKDRILEHGISHASTLEETYTPQYKALTWLVRDDERQLDLPLIIDDQAIGMSGSDVDTERTLFQRYALAVIWYQSTNLEIVKESMTGSQVENPFDNKNDIDPLTFTQKDITWNRNTNWMSDKGLCLWHGITCHAHDNDITGNDNNHDNKNDDDWYVSILNLTDNNINGIVPREVYTGFNKLKALDLSRNGLKGTLMKELGEMKDLEDLFLFENNFSGEIPHDIGKLGNLYNLYINNNKFRGRLPTQFGDLTKLRGASIYNNRMDGTIPDSIGNLKDMIALYLDTNKFSGQIPTSIGKMESMIDLRLRQNDLTGMIPTEVGDLGNLETLYLDSNGKIGGTVPKELSKLAKITELHLYEMNLTGELPSELGLLDGLLYLYLDTNDLKGTIPEDWGGMSDLEQLFLTGNNLSGWLPQSIRGMRSLKMFRAADNLLSGPIRSDLGKLTKLEYIYLEDNNFSGMIPPELGELTKLKLLHLADNNLTGELPPEICKLQKDFALRDLTADCGEMTCTCEL